MTLSPIEILKSVADLDVVAEASHREPVLLFKHSLTCPFSARAQEQFVEIEGVPRYALTVQYAKDISEAVAERFETEHASPQLLIIKDGEVIQSLYRSEIQTEAVEAFVTLASQG